ncbi:MAG: hypothetical protein R6V74_05235 [Lutibacter sp.]
MKHLKKLSVVLMMITLFSGTFTSCIDNEVSPLVEAIYEAQADLIAAQANVQNAEAALLLAQAANEEANAALLEAQATAAVSIAQGQLAVLLANAGLTDAQAQAILSAAEGDLAQALADAGLTEAQAAQILADIADQEANAEYTAAVREQQLLALVAQTSLDVAALQNELALAQIQFDVDMAAAIAAMEAAGVQLAVGYAWDYAYAMQHANGLMQDLLEAQADLASAELMQNGNVSWEFYLAQMEGNVATAMAAKANLETAIADLEAYIADPSTPEAMISDLKAQNIALQDAMDAKNVEMQVQYNKIMALYNQDNDRNQLVTDAMNALYNHNYAVGEKNYRLDWIETAEASIATWQLAIDNYDAALAALQLTKNNATTAKNTAQTAYNTASAAQVTANNAQIAAASALTTLENELASLYAALQTAANTLATQQAIYDGGIGTATSDNTTAIANVTAAEGALTIALANYNLWKGVFEANPAGSTWFDKTTVLGNVSPNTDGYENPFIGNHSDMIGTSYREVLTWVEGPVGEFYPATYAAVSVATIPTDNLPLEDYEEFTSAAYPNGLNTGIPTVEFYVEVEADDISETNLAIFNAMVAALGDEEIFDNAPELGDMPLAGSDAYTNLWNAQLAQLGTQDTLDNFGDNLADALEDYNYWKNLYENELDLLNAAQALLDDANATLAAANTTKANALTTLNLAITAETNAINALNAFLALPDEDVLQGWIDAALLNIAQWNEDISNIQPIIDAEYAVVASLLGELTDAGVEYTFVVNADGTGTLTITNDGVIYWTYPDIQAQIIAEWQVYWTMGQEMDALWDAYYLNQNLIYAYGWWANDLDDLANMLAGLQEDLVEAIEDIELAEQALADAQVEEAADEAYIAYLEALIDTIEQRHANTLAIAAKYKALMEAALAS